MTTEHQHSHEGHSQAPHAHAPANGQSPAPSDAKKKPERQAEVISMHDGRQVEFVGKKRLLKESFFNPDGSVDFIRLDFRNGATRKFYIPASLYGRFAAHGAEQKLGDETAGESDLDDMVVAVDELMEQLSSGEWGAKREGGMSGIAILIKALAEGMSKSEDQIKAFLKGKSGAERTALSNHHKIKPIFTRLQEEKAAKAAHVDSDALLASLDAAG